ncbi:MAG: hypothetical protein ACON38_04290 [Akkermansiaceae bacterium]
MDEAVEALLPAIAEQLDSSDTPYVREAYDRILNEPDIDDEEARSMLAFCLADEVEAMTNEERPFDVDRYQLLLSLLPAMPEGR